MNLTKNLWLRNSQLSLILRNLNLTQVPASSRWPCLWAGRWPPVGWFLWSSAPASSPSSSTSEVLTTWIATTIKPNVCTDLSLTSIGAVHSWSDANRTSETIEEGTCKVLETIQEDMKERKKRKTIICDYIQTLATLPTTVIARKSRWHLDTTRSMENSQILQNVQNPSPDTPCSALRSASRPGSDWCSEIGTYHI